MGGAAKAADGGGFGAEPFDLEAWRAEHPMDYFWAVDFLRGQTDPALQDCAFQAIFQVCKLHVPSRLRMEPACLSPSELPEALLCRSLLRIPV